MNYKQKYIKYKNKYLNLKKQYGGAYVQLLEDDLSIRINSNLLPEVYPSGIQSKHQYNKDYFTELITNILDSLQLKKDINYTINVDTKVTHIYFINCDKASIEQYYHKINKILSDKFKDTYLWFDDPIIGRATKQERQAKNEERQDIIKWNILFNIFCLLENNITGISIDHKYAFYKKFKEFIDEKIYIHPAYTFNMTLYELKKATIHFTGVYLSGSGDNYWHFTYRKPAEDTTSETIKKRGSTSKTSEKPGSTSKTSKKPGSKNKKSSKEPEEPEDSEDSEDPEEPDHSRRARTKHFTKKDFVAIIENIHAYTSTDYEKLFYFNLFYIILLYETDKKNIINMNYAYFKDKYETNIEASTLNLDDYSACSYIRHNLSENREQLLILKQIILDLIHKV